MNKYSLLLTLSFAACTCANTENKTDAHPNEWFVKDKIVSYANESGRQLEMLKGRVKARYEYGIYGRNK